jgi:hypothetical protein
MRQTEKGARLAQDIAQMAEPAIALDEVQQVATLTGRGVCPLSAGAGAVIGPAQADEQAFARIVLGIPHHPVIAGTATI